MGLPDDDIWQETASVLLSAGVNSCLVPGTSACHERDTISRALRWLRLYEVAFDTLDIHPLWMFQQSHDSGKPPPPPNKCK